MVHPLDQLTSAEAKKSVKIIKDNFKGSTIHIKNLQIEEPPKREMIKFLDAEHAGHPIAPPPRIVYSVLLIMAEKRATQVWIDLDKGSIVKTEAFPIGKQPMIDMDEGGELEEILFKSPEYKDALAKCGITGDLVDLVNCDPWVYGADLPLAKPRYVMFLMFMQDPKTRHKESNIYSLPLPFVPVLDSFEGKVARIDWCATGDDSDDKLEINYNTRSNVDSVVDCFKCHDYMPELRDKPMRTDLQPYNVIQPNGPSFKTDGTLVNWQKWSFRVMFNPREGLVIGDVRYDKRLLFYRLSVSEMTVPYGDPRPPLHRKQAFDLGDYGAGHSANVLGLGCDCLGVIKYFDGTLVHPNGEVEVRPRVVCMHEQDDGILLKHTNFRTGVGRVVRRRVLILQTVLTVANYEYIFNWHFDQVGCIELEIRATGVISTQFIDPGKKSKWGTVVGPSVLAAGHQHIFSMRVDPAIDGHSNSIKVHETKLPPRGAHNPYGTGFYDSSKYVERSSAFDANQAANRYVKIVNENKIHPVTMEPVGYKLAAFPSALIMAPEGTVARSRAEYATHHFWVTKYRDNELYAGGPWTNQSFEETGGCSDAVKRDENVRNDDVVLWHSFGLTHYPRIEDFPIMPIEKITVGLHPSGFFDENPAMDVPTSDPKFNRSIEVKETRGHQHL